MAKKSKLNLINDDLTWNADRRYKVNSVVQLNGEDYQNITGKNSNPELLIDWQELLSPTLVDQTIIDGSTNAVSSNAVFDGLALKSNIGHTHVASQITDLSKASVGLGNVDNTSDLNKIISTATQTALNAKANISGQVFTGAVSSTNLSGTNTGDNAPNSLYSGLVTNATHTGEVTGSTALTITNGAVTNAKLANVATSTLKGRVAAATGVVEDLTASQVRTLLNVADGANNYVHPANHLASIITQDASNRFVTDTEKSAWNAKESAIASGTISQYWRGDKTWQEFPTIQTIDNIPTDGSNNAVSSNAVFDGLALKSNIGHTHVASQITDLSKASVGLGNVDNTSDLSKPLSTATINALATKAPISSVHNPVTLGTANGLSLSTQQISLGLASSGVTGALSGTDWNTFNGKFNTPTGLTTNYLPKWNGSGFVDSTARDLGDGIFELITPKGTSPIYRFTQYAWRTWDIGVKPSPSFPSFYIRDASSSIDRFIIADGGRILINKTDDDLTNQLQVAGTILASPATTANQVVIKSQLDAVAARPYKVYTALLSQTGTNAPVATVLENTLGGTVVWSRIAVGEYKGTLSGVFTVNKTTVFISPFTPTGTSVFITGQRDNADGTIYLRTVNNSGTTTIDTALGSQIEIRVYL